MWIQQIWPSHHPPALLKLRFTQTQEKNWCYLGHSKDSSLWRSAQQMDNQVVEKKKKLLLGAHHRLGKVRKSVHIPDDVGNDDASDMEFLLFARLLEPHDIVMCTQLGRCHRAFTTSIGAPLVALQSKWGFHVSAIIEACIVHP